MLRRTPQEREDIGLSKSPRPNKKLHTSMWRKVSAYGLGAFVAVTFIYFFRII